MQYDGLSIIYDKFNDDFSYTKYLEKTFKRFGLPSSGLALDCGCGTGSLLVELLKKGYDCTGVDSSENMLQQAAEKIENSGFYPHLICQDIITLDLFGAYDIVFCTLDTVNHILDKRILKTFFRNLYNFIEPNGWFIFDVKTKDAFVNACDNIISSKNDWFMTVQGSFDGRYAEYEFNVFERFENGMYNHISDVVDERYYTNDELKYMLQSVGLIYKGIVKFKDRNIIGVQKIITD